MPYLAFIARLYHGIEAISRQAERIFSALAHLIGDLCGRMLVSKVERMMFIRLNMHLIGEVRKLDAAVPQARARVAKSAQESVAAQEERSNMSVDLTYRYHKWSCELYPSCTCRCSVFSRHFFCDFFLCFGGYIKISMVFDFIFAFRFHDVNGCLYSFKMKHDNRSFACCFYLEFWHENVKSNVRRVYVQG